MMGGCACAVSQRSGWTPAALGAGLKIWLRGDAGLALSGSAVTSWTDQGPNTEAWTQGTGANQPTTRQVNGRTAIDFDGVNDFLGSTHNASVFLGATPGDLEIDVVYVADTFTASADGSWSVTAACLVGAQASARYNLLVGTTAAYSAEFTSTPAVKVATSATAPSTGAVHRARFVINGTTDIQANDGSGAAGTTATGAVPASSNYGFPIDLARNPGQTIFFDGVLCEIIVSGSVLTATQQALLDAWLKERWSAIV